MTKGAEGESCCRLPLLEASPGSLADARLAWPVAEVFSRSLGETQGVADLISRGKIQIVFSDLPGGDSVALDTLSPIRSVHPHLPLVAILAEEDFPSGLVAFRKGDNDVLVRQLDHDKLELLFDALVDNVVKFNRPDGRLSVSAGNLTLHGKPTIYLQITNQGKTVPRENAEDIFQDYSQFGEIGTGKSRSIGVGLAT